MATRCTMYLKRIREFIKRDDVKFALCNLSTRYNHGYCISNSSDTKIIIVLDPRKEFIPTLFHECLHGIYQKYKEPKIQSLEKFIMKNASQKQIMEMLKFFCDNATMLKKTEIISDLI